MPSPHDPNRPSSAGLAVGDAGTETGQLLSTQETGTLKGTRRSTRFWLGLAALVVGLATLAIVFFFFSGWADALEVESGGAGLVLLAALFLLVTGAWRVPSSQPISAAPDAEAERAEVSSPAATLESPESATTDLTPAAPADAPPEPATLVSAPAPEPAAAPATPQAAPPEASAADAPEAATTETAAAPTRKAARPKTGQPTQNGHSGPMAVVRPTEQVSDDAVSRPTLSGLAQNYPRPSGGYTLDAQAEDLSQLLGDVAEQTVIAIATRGQRGVERRERMASKIDAFSQEMAVDADYAPVVAFLRAISALLRAGQPIPATQTLVDPFDGLYGYVLTLIRRKTGRTHD